jgi:hypothetical protein
MKQLIEDLISALEYHVEQTRPIYSTTVALQAAREALKSLPPQRTWVGLTNIDYAGLPLEQVGLVLWAEAKLKEKNT